MKKSSSLSVHSDRALAALSVDYCTQAMVGVAGVPGLRISPHAVATRTAHLAYETPEALALACRLLRELGDGPLATTVRARCPCAS